MAAEARSPFTRLAASGRARRRPAVEIAGSDSAVWLLRLLRAALLASFLVVFAGLLFRRLVLLDARPPGPWWVLAVAATVALLGLLTRDPAPQADSGATESGRWGQLLRPLVLLLVATSVSVRGGHLVPILVLWATVFVATRREFQTLEDRVAAFVRHASEWMNERPTQRVADEASPSSGIDDPGSDRATFDRVPRDSQAKAHVADATADEVESSGEEPAVPHALPEANPLLAAEQLAEVQEIATAWTDGMDQQWVRGRDEAGVAYCSGQVRVPVAAGQRVVSWHAVLCPAFDKTPEVEVDVVGGLEAECQLTQVLRHGWRAELKLARVAEQDAEVLLEFYAWDANGTNEAAGETEELDGPRSDAA